MTTRTLDLANVISSDATFTGDKTFSGDITFSGDVVPSSPLSHRNLVINGAMEVAQRGTSAVTATANFPVDRFRSDFDTDGTFSFQQVSESPANFQYSIKWTVTGTDTSFSASQYAYFRTILEGQDIAHLNWGSSDARTVTLSFYIKSSATGTFGGAVWNNAFNRSYPFTYTVSSANTWERKSITIPGDTSGTWETGNGRGINIAPLGFAGSNYIAAAGSWDAGGRVTATGATNFMATNSATYHFTGVQLELGDNATPFEHRSFGDELTRCHRYFYRLNGATDGTEVDNQWYYMLASSGANQYGRATIQHPVEMRTTVTVTNINNSGNFSGSGSQFLGKQQTTLYVNSVTGITKLRTADISAEF